MKFLESLSDGIINRSPEELIGALFIAAAVADRRGGDLRALVAGSRAPPRPLSAAWSFAAGALCMALAAGYIEYAGTDWTSGFRANQSWHPRDGRRAVLDRVPAPPPWGFFGAGWSSGFHVVVAADENRDGRLTPEEVARMVRTADTDGDGSVNFRDIDRLIAARFLEPSLRRRLTVRRRPSDRRADRGPAADGGRPRALDMPNTPREGSRPAIRGPESHDPEWRAVSTMNGMPVVERAPGGLDAAPARVGRLTQAQRFPAFDPERIFVLGRRRPRRPALARRVPGLPAPRPA